MKVIKKILLWSFSVLLFILLLPLLLLLFFTPLRYTVVARRTKSETTVRAKASYLFRLITVQYVYRNGKGTSRVRLAGILLGGSKGKIPSAKPEPYKEEGENTEAGETKFDKTGITVEKNDPVVPLPQKTAEKPNRNLRNVLTYPELKTIIRLTLHFLKKTMKVLLPKRFDVYGTVGFEDPALTGMVIGFYETVAALLSIREKVRVSADFAESGVTFKVYAAGSVSVSRLTRPVVWLLIKKPIRKFIAFLRKDQ
ncbi:MAG: hypothetical protein FWE90_14215 [Defluviitaleaceae bacterium]|nr:hypothetical protein [Defluviitaleaceae bacterium]